MRVFKHLLLPVFIVMMTACATQEYRQPVASDISLAVASFTQPRSMGELLAGYIPEDRGTVDTPALRALDAALDQVLHEQTKRAYKPAAQAMACQKLPGEPMEPASPLKYWVQVGECLKVDYLIVPTLIHWQERLGTNMGVTRPAGVTMDMYVVDVAGKTLLSRAHFEEIQAALSDNLLAAPQFFSRGARWLTTEELAREGLMEMVKELGL